MSQVTSPVSLTRRAGSLSHNSLTSQSALRGTAPLRSKGARAAQHKLALSVSDVASSSAVFMQTTWQVNSLEQRPRIWRASWQHSPSAQPVLGSAACRHSTSLAAHASTDSVSEAEEASPRPLNAIIIGGSSGMGKGAAKEVVKHGGRVLIASRSIDKLERAKQEIINSGADEAQVETCQLDNTVESEVRAFFARAEDGAYDALVISAADRAVHGAFLELDTAEVRDFWDSKFWGPYYCAKHAAPKLRDGGAIVFFSGVLNRRPGLNCSPLAGVNGAMEGLTRALALELGPRLRVNCFSPGFMDTERFDHMPQERRDAMLENTAQSLPLKRVGAAEDAGQALYFLMSNSFTTGVVLDCDGGHQIRQYANPTNDPFRKSKSAN